LKLYTFCKLFESGAFADSNVSFCFGHSSAGCKNGIRFMIAGK
jgi:hypothetical protein